MKTHYSPVAHFLVVLCEPGIFMLVAGFFRLPKDIPKPLWRYPLSYLGFDMYALQVRKSFTHFL
jgi:hypothetical protein